MNRTTCTTKQWQKSPGKGCRKISIFQGRENELQGRRLSPCLREAWRCYRQFFLPSDWQRILLFSSSFSCFRRAFSSSRSLIRYGTRQRVTAGCRAELQQGFISPAGDRGLYSSSLCFLEDLFPCALPLILFTPVAEAQEKCTATTETYFPFP